MSCKIFREYKKPMALFSIFIGVLGLAMLTVFPTEVLSPNEEAKILEHKKHVAKQNDLKRCTLEELIFVIACEEDINNFIDYGSGQSKTPDVQNIITMDVAKLNTSWRKINDLSTQIDNEDFKYDLLQSNDAINNYIESIGTNKIPVAKITMHNSINNFILRHNSK
ncbi:MAG: hypothetical protein H6Q74_1819 [Firmicutes bacterium]|nr:hypothetical protein [Bacillota bacterium]